jgi:hypothetical protein
MLSPFGGFLIPTATPVILQSKVRPHEEGILYSVQVVSDQAFPSRSVSLSAAAAKVAFIRPRVAPGLPQRAVRRL